jgi:hypothetical protein
MAHFEARTCVLHQNDGSSSLIRVDVVRLIEPGMAEQDTTRRRALLSDFDLADVSGKHQMQETLEIFIKARLLTTNQSRGTTTVEVIHHNVGEGGGIENQGKLTVTNSTISNNSVSSSDNSSSGYGGGIYNSPTGTFRLINSIVSNNSITSSNSSFSNSGGGIDNEGSTSVNNSIISNNSVSGGSSFGGGIDNTKGAITVMNSTISNNKAVGSAGYGEGTVTIIYFSTIYGNTSKAGRGIWVDPTGSSHLITGSSIVATNNAHEGPDISGLLISRGYNLLGNVSGVSELDPTTDRQVTLSNLRVDSTLHNNGGPTQTLALLPGSSAIDAVPLQACRITFSGDFPGHTETITTDQRSEPRPNSSENACDVGAFESSY